MSARLRENVGEGAAWVECLRGSWESESRSVVSDSATPWTIQSVEFSRPEYWRGEPFPSSRGSSQPRDQIQVSALLADSLPAEPQGKPKGLLKHHKLN